ncbi:MAG TPA: hypothetical protein VLN49_07700 [Gemmatimonadaceae bacterium]|nr:hypothetical protein [Gemmatimonadaceae bacterium]
MITRTLLRSAALALVIGAALPVPASPQIGGLIKKKVKQTIEQTRVGTDTASKASAARAHGPSFDEATLEITPALLDRFEKGVTAEAAERKEVERQIAKFLPRDAFEKCRQSLMRTPEAQAAYREYTGMLKGTDQEAMRKASEWYGKRLSEITRPKCGPSPSEAEIMKGDLLGGPEKVGEKAAGLTERQYAVLKERVLPFCTAAASSGSGELKVEGGFVYTTAEMEALRPRCATLLPALR